MLARKTIIKHPCGIRIETPLFIPSFSSKGFRYNKVGESEVNSILDFSSEWLTKTYLISAYDLKYFYPKHDEFNFGFTEFVFIDSGGYETLEEHDLSTVFHFPHNPKEWTQELYKTILAKWPKQIPIVVISYDNVNLRRDTLTQINTAESLFGNFPGQLYDFLLKPETNKQILLDKAINSLENHLDKLSSFNFIGVTEKEMGSSLLDRMKNIARLRIILDSGNLNIPIHVFGSLDPLTTCLYFLSGAEVFDGLTWLRYSYLDGKAIYNTNYSALKLNIGDNEEKNNKKAIVDNIYYLDSLEDQLNRFLNTQDFGQIKCFGNTIKEHYNLLKSKIGMV